ncbi:MAG TPA: aminopeptidase [Thermoplasmata archaeon]|nr:aminopeptidase [Thermoplasmata archaeon]
MPTLAENAVKNCLRIRPDDNVAIWCYPHTLPLAEDIARECFKVGADALLAVYTDRFYADYMKYLSAENLRRPSAFCRGLSELSTAVFWAGAAEDPAVYRKVPSDKMAANDEAETEAHRPMRERKVRSLSLGISLVTKPRAKAYGYNFAAWQRMVQAASAVPAKTLAATGQRLAGILGTADEVTVTAPGGTDLAFSVRGKSPMIYDGIVDDEDVAAGVLDASIPAGSVSVFPVETSATGHVVFDVPQAWAGRTIRRMRWDFRDGRITEFEGDANALALRKQYEAASGDRDRIASFTIGTNPKATLGFLQNAIVRGSVSIGVGANDFIGGTNKSSFGFESAVKAATVEVDGKPILREGKLLVA